MHSRLGRLLVKLLIATALVGGVTAADFGVAQWGDSLGEVRDRETLPNLTPLSASDYLIYEVTLPGIHRVRLVYEFENGRLHQGRFLFWPVDGAPASAWINQFDQVQSLLSQQYQQPDQRQTLSPEGISPPSPAHWAQALEADQLILKNLWQLEGTHIVQQLAWRDQSPHHQAIYRPVTH